MPVITDLKKEARKSLILHELTKPEGEKDYKGIADKYHWDSGLTKELVADIQTELEDINTFNRARLTVRAAPKAVDRLDSALNGDYEEPENKIRAGELGLRTLKALDPKLRTQELRVQHGGNVLLTIQSVYKGLGEAIEANYEVLPNQSKKIEPEPSQLLYKLNQPTNTSAQALNVQPEPSNRADNV